MPTPPPNNPVRGFSFTDHSTNFPATPQPGDKIDQELDRSNAAITQLKAFVRQSLADDGSIKPGAIGNDQLGVDLTTDITADVLAQVNPQVAAAAGHASAAQNSAIAADASADEAQNQANAAAGHATTASTGAVGAAASAIQAQTHAVNASNASAAAVNARNTAQVSEGKALNYAVLSQYWSEFLDGNNPIPGANLDQMGVTGSHWSARWWALQAGIYAAAAGNPNVPLAPKSIIGNLTALDATPTAVPVHETATFDGANDGAIPTSKAVADHVAANYQPLDSDLTAIAALATTPFGRALLTRADDAAARSAINVDIAGTAAALVAGHLAALDPHPQYTDATELAAALAAYQPLDSDLTAIAALATTAYGRSFLALADAAAARALLGLGTAALNNTGDFQPIDADLTAIAALATTAYGRSFLTLADAAAARSLVGLTNAALLDVSQTWTAGQTPLTAALTDGATVNWNGATAQVAEVTCTAARTFAAPTNLVNRRFYGLMIQNSGGAWAHAFNAAFIFDSNDGTPGSFPAGSRLQLTFRSDGTNLREWGRRLVAS